MNCIKTALLRCQITFWESRRFRGKINIQRPRQPHFERQLLIDISKPIFGPSINKLPEFDSCGERKTRSKKVDVDNPFERILARECLQWFNTSKMVVFFHLNPIKMRDKLPIFADLARNDMHLRKYGKKIVQMATSGTRFEAVNQLFTSHQEILFGQPDKADKMFRIIKKAPQLVVMAGIIEDKLLSKNELVQFSKLPDLQIARSQVCGILHSAGTVLVSQLNQAQQSLVSHLDRHVELDNKINEENKNVET